MFLSELNCLFVHIPKVAGNSVMRALGHEQWENHRDLACYFEFLGREVVEGAFKFAVVRNPWDRLLSEYNFQLRKGQRKDTVRLFLHRADGSVRPFGEWVRHAFEHPEEHQPREWGGTVSPWIHRLSPQVEWISEGGKVGVDLVARMESLPADFRTICERLGVGRKRLGKRNGKFHWHYRHYYNQETRGLVGRYYQSDIEEFSYSFGR